MPTIVFHSFKSTRLTEIERNIERALEACGGTAERYAKENLTKNKSVITNTLRGSITHQKVSKDTVAVGTDVQYAPYVELGHHQEPGRYVPAIGKRLKASFVQGKPYLRPAVEDHRNEYEQIIRSELKT